MIGWLSQVTSSSTTAPTAMPGSGARTWRRSLYTSGSEPPLPEISMVFGSSVNTLPSRVTTRARSSGCVSCHGAQPASRSASFTAASVRIL